MPEPTESRIAEAYAQCLVQLRDLDRDRYLACLLVPAEKRLEIASLYAFNAEIARVRDVVHDPVPGEIRLQWWRDVLATGTPEAARGHPVATALSETIRRNRLPVATFEAYLEARVFDLYDDPMPDRAALEGYAGETASALLQLSALVLDPDAARKAAEAAGHAGVGQTIAGILLLMPRHRARGQVFVPSDILAACGLDQPTFLGTADAASLRAVVAALVALGREHLAAARQAAGTLPATIFPAFLPAALVEPVFDRAERSELDPRQAIPQQAQWRRQWRLFRAIRARRF